ncbi:Unknown protein [Striga hermonthica]|uniref:Uncharacterized protein n=1 Tax=Striga hermonthica TaxID=68872 RepID=A0A9N7MQ59_STRHE|nr:Unknown protein [Striga hermonthica]
MNVINIHNFAIFSQQRVLGYRGRFEDLEIEQKLDVYAAILERSGRMRILSGQSEELADFSEEDLKCPGGQWDLNTAVKPSVELYSSRRRLRLKSAAMFFKDMCTIIWDIYSSDHTIQTVTRDALVTAAEKGGAALGKLVAVAIATRLTGQAATTLFITAVGLVGGFVGAFILGAVAGLLFDLIFSSGGQAPLPTDGFIVYVAPMPDGRRLARQIA